MALIRYVGLDLITRFEGAALQLRGLVDMQTHFVASRIMHRILFPLNLQHIPFDNLGAGRAR